MMGTTETTYAISVNFDGDVAQELAKLRAGYREHMTFTAIPHITLVYPFTPAGDIENVVFKLKEVGKRQKPFKVTLEGIKYFETVNNVAYVAVKDREPLETLAVDIIESIREVVQGYYADKGHDPRHFIPHLTIGEKIPHDKFTELKKKFANHQVRHECKVTDFYLAGETGGEWKMLHVFGLAG
jgi:2'-5' RNA ligase